MTSLSGVEMSFPAEVMRLLLKITMKSQLRGI